MNEQTLNTLLENGLAASRSEAQRMASSMISTSDKVNEGMRKSADNYMVSNYKQETKAPQATPAPVQAPITGTPKEQRIQELRQSALNPQPVQVQTEFDTPATQRRNDLGTAPTLPTAEPTLEVEHSNDNYLISKTYYL